MSTIGFYGGAGSVTGANFLLDTGEAKILIDCGLRQGGKFALAENAEPFAYDPHAVGALCVTHAHADHIGRIPQLVKAGFRGAIYSTPPTKDLAAVMLRDAFGIMAAEARAAGLPPLYGLEHIDEALALWKTADYGERFEAAGGVTAHFENAGHILGSAFVYFERGGKTLVFTGDVGNVPQPLLDAPEQLSGVDYLVMESVYGDRSHEEVDERSGMLLAEIRRTIERKGTLVIPAFSLERTQGLLYELNRFVESGEIKPLPVFLDAPLAIAVTELYRTHRTYLKKSVQDEIAAGDDVFDFPKLSLTRAAEDSRGIASVPGPKIIIAGAGMSHGGRVRSHEAAYLPDPDATVLMVGYQSVGSLGRLLQDGAKEVTIDGKKVRVRARIASIRGYSAHADREQLIELVAGTADSLKEVFVAMGEERASLHLVQRLRDYLGVKAVAPGEGEAREIGW